MNALIPFDFKNNAVRVIVDDTGEPWFLAMDVADILGYSDAEAMTRKLDVDEVQNRQFVGFGNRGVNVINESGLYSCILTSKKKEAKAFKKWLTSEVLPSIRKTGSYSAKQPAIDLTQLLNDPVAAHGLLLGYTGQIIALKDEIKVLEPQAAALQRISGGDGSQCITDTAKAIGIERIKLLKWLSENRWIYKRSGGKNWLGYQPRITQGLIEHKCTTVNRQDGSEKVCVQVLITPKGIAKLAGVLS